MIRFTSASWRTSPIYKPFGGELPLPGNIASPDRSSFALATFALPAEPATYAEAVAGPVLIARNVAGAARSAIRRLCGGYPTWWISAVDVTNRIYHFQERRRARTSSGLNSTIWTSPRG